MPLVTEFNDHLSRNAPNLGANWVKSDFHIHCPKSSDYEYKDADAMKALGQTLHSENYRLAIILKHQEFPTHQELEELQTYCPKTTLIPGAELNIFVDAIFKKVSRNYFFHSILAVDPETSGDYGFLLQRARQEFSYKTGEYPEGFTSSILDIGKFFLQQGAIFMPAHLHQSKPSEETKSVDDLYDDDAFLGFIEDGAFSALEVRQSSTAEFFTGDKTTNDGRRIPHAVCLQSSDAHSHKHIIDRNRKTWIQIEKPTFPELLTSLSFPHRVSLTVPKLPSQRILGVHIIGAFLPDLWISFNAGMNSFIGVKGSGKTSILECLRFLFNSSVPRDRSESVSRHLTHILGPSGVVECLVQRSDGKRFVLSRRADAPQRLTITDEIGRTQDVTRVEEYFDISILGWHEIEAVAEDASARIRLLDGIEGAQTIRDKYTIIDQNVEKARDQLPILQQNLRRLDEALKELWDLQRKRDTLRKLEKEELVSLQSEYEWYLAAEQKMTSHKVKLEKNRLSLSEVLPFKLSESLAAELGASAPMDLQESISNVSNALQNLSKSDSENNVLLLQGSNAVIDIIDKAVVAVNQSFTTFRDTVYIPRVQLLQPEERDILTRQIQILEETRTLPQKEEDCKTLHMEVIKLASIIENLCEEVCKARDEICQIRESTVLKVNQDLDSVRLTFRRGGNKSRFTRYQEKYAKDSGNFVNFLQGYGQSEAYQNFRELFHKLQSVDIGSAGWKVNELIWDIKFVDFLSVVDDDDVEIALQVGTLGFASIQNLSSGQRCTAVFPLLLRNARGPLVIDQPEDNLDNRHIADSIAPDLLGRKSEQQYITTSHNANLVVLTDADLIFQMHSDGRSGWIESSGFLACPHSPIRRAVLDILDGGETALEARRRKYGFANVTK